MVTLENVKNALGITGDYQDDVLQIYVDEVIAFLVNAGVPSANITTGIVARGVSDLWNYGAGEGKLSSYFMQRAAQLASGSGSSAYVPSSDGGSSGKDGFSPTIESVPIPGGYQLIITDVNGTRTVDILNGKDGKDGVDGEPGKDGANGKDGVDGKDYVLTEQDKADIAGLVVNLIPSAESEAY